jgi:hypothetical protein
MINSPCAKLIMPIMPKAMLRPNAVSNRIELILNPLIKEEIISCIINS